MTGTTSPRSGDDATRPELEEYRPGEGTFAPAAGTSGSVASAALDDPGTAGAEQPGRWANLTSWLSLLCAVLITIWQAYYYLSIDGLVGREADMRTAVNNFGVLILSLVAIVLGIVGLAQRRGTRWPAVAGLAVGINAFVIAAFSWASGVMNT